MQAPSTGRRAIPPVFLALAPTRRPALELCAWWTVVWRSFWMPQEALLISVWYSFWAMLSRLLVQPSRLRLSPAFWADFPGRRLRLSAAQTASRCLPHRRWIESASGQQAPSWSARAGLLSKAEAADSSSCRPICVRRPADDRPGREGP